MGIFLEGLGDLKKDCSEVHWVRIDWILLRMRSPILHPQSPHPKVELLVSAEHKHDFVARETAETVHAAFDLVLHKMQQQLKRYKQKVQGHRSRSSSSQEYVEEGGGSEAASENET